MGFTRGITVCMSIVAWMALVLGINLSVAPASAVEPEVKQAESELYRAAHTDPSHGNTTTDPLSFDPDLALWTLIVFLVLLAVLWKFAWDPILASLQKRENSIANDIAEAQRQHEEAKTLLEQYEAKLTAAADEVRSIIEDGRREADVVKQSILAEAKSGAEAERGRALRDIESATTVALQSLAERSATLAVELAGKLVRQNLAPGDHARLIQDALDKFPTSSRN